MKTLQVGVIGIGAIGRSHVKRLSKQVSGVRVVAVSDVNREAAKQIAAAHGAAFFESASDLITDKAVEAVLVCASDATHEQYVLECIAEGKFVFCEKPLSETSQGCKNILEAEIKTNRRLVQVGFMRRYDSGYRSLKDTAERMLGAPLMVHCAHRNASPGANYETRINVTGVAIHEIDVMRWLLRDEYVSAQIRNARTSGYVERGQIDPQLILLQTRGGTLISIETFMHCRYGYDIQCEIVGENGTACLPQPTEVVTKMNGVCEQLIQADWRERFHDAYNLELQEWVDGVTHGLVTGPTAWDGYAAIVAAEACLKSAEFGTIEPVQLPNRPALYEL